MNVNSAYPWEPARPPTTAHRGWLPVPLAGALVAAISAVVPCLVLLAITGVEVAVSAYIAAVPAGFLAAGLAIRRHQRRRSTTPHARAW